MGRSQADPKALQAVFSRLEKELSGLSFALPVTHVYNPLLYARAPFTSYLERFLAGPCGRTLLLGMNPGPWGMAQTGVPFGEVAAVRDWLGISGPVGQPANPHPARPIAGFACPRSEVSGRRLWGLFAESYPDSKLFARDFVVLNYCPLVFMEDTGRNRTPDKLPRAERETLFAACDRALSELLRILRPARAIGVGRFALDRLRNVAEGEGLAIPLDTILHPSPANPQANADWPGRCRPTLGLAAPGKEVPCSCQGE
jgi:single-strand selective monofunctional uracil DNA glycosylase